MGRAYQNRKDSIAKTSDAKAKVYSKYARELYVCGKAGGVDPAGNLALRSLLERAKKDQVPAHVIDKALDKAAGGAGEDFEVARYEGYGPGGSMVIVDCLTDNATRTFNDVRLCFTKCDCKIGNQGAVMHMFDHLGIFVFPHDDEDAVLEALMEADVDVSEIESENGVISVFVPQQEYAKAKQTLADALGDISFDVDEIQFVPQATTDLDEVNSEHFARFYSMLEYLDDVQRIFHNVGNL
ncbi:MAG: YebC/PmpR family DNA-binding transcriptional regulator [Gammaproteobacteria bacterium]|nr:YebC/PmpR family DNA-binding transcriptional regulator [Gammaproteobacteria bacterium]NND39545.1 YebC/PmpR family DNA-binding transcriptional regulator [Pseudomonadales bacterium]MBT8151086.1 YebC/PmpR family DNA-binding transcriptional regulator [Gammaproteobacteria bacterium]NNL10580.1 YebC/PmpR family DNA-binding transcriptional regulator [Pseudomonadales bacterium]NNM11841.1 YebC/PmpR family DNA-binding transcriptional regulator [Pseudomonadales bacterium]